MTTADYVDPYAGAHVVGERIDMGLDAAGTGTLGAIARGVVTKIEPAGSSGWPGQFIEYKVTQSGPLFGQSIFYAEGVTPASGLHVGQTVNAGDPIAQLIPGWSTGTETGFASGVGTGTYAAQHGGYTEGRSTAAGKLWADIVAGLGGPKGKLQSGPLQGSAPDFTAGALHSTSGGAVQDAAGAVGQAASDTAAIAGDIAHFVSSPQHALLTVGLIVLGAMLIYSGTGKLLGFDQPIRGTGRAARGAATAAAEASA